MEPVRIQRKRTKGWKMPPNTVYVGRPTKWGNPYKIGDIGFAYEVLEKGKMIKTNQDAVEVYKKWLISDPSAPSIVGEVIQELRGKNLCCWCSLDEPCHADFLLQLASSPLITNY